MEFRTIQLEPRDEENLRRLMEHYKMLNGNRRMSALAVIRRAMQDQIDDIDKVKIAREYLNRGKRGA
ncbi:MAG: hypothetical protein EOP83_21965 [Verrucomicrobiaceae bacterium]|nr:MAG: hypothetical protein EOP83_21965 [Verrucomicrobiaceae bacterium]